MPPPPPLHWGVKSLPPPPAILSCAEALPQLARISNFLLYTSLAPIHTPLFFSFFLLLSVSRALLHFYLFLFHPPPPLFLHLFHHSRVCESIYLSLFSLFQSFFLSSTCVSVCLLVSSCGFMTLDIYSRVDDNRLQSVIFSFFFFKHYFICREHFFAL